MAKTTATEATTAKAKKTATVKKVAAISFGAWLKTAKARKPIATFISELKADKKIKDTTAIKYVEGKYGTHVDFPVVKARYERVAYKAA